MNAATSFTMYIAMDRLKRAAEIAKSLEDTKGFRGAGQVTVGVGSVLLAAIPGLGALGTALDKVGSRLFDADLEPKFVELCRLVSTLSPDIERITSLEERLSAVALTVSENKALLERVEALAAKIDVTAQEVFGVYTNQGSQSFSEIVIENMRVVAEAHGGGANRFHRVQTSNGDVKFIATGGAEQHVSESVFRGRGGAVGLDQVSLGGHMGVDTTGGAGIGFGPNGSISFGPGGSIGFGPPLKKPKP